MAPTVRDRVERLTGRLAVPGYLLGLWSLFGGWSRIEFIFRKTDEFLAVSYARPLLFLAAVAWLTWLVTRPVNQSDERLAKIKELLAEAAGEFRTTDRDPADLDATTDAAFRHMKLLFFLDRAFKYKIKRDYSDWLKEEHDRWKDAGEGFPVDTATGNYLDDLVRTITVKDLDFGSYLPETYEQYRKADNWQPNRRPVP